MMRIPLWIGLLAALAACSGEKTAPAAPAKTLFINGHIYTANANRDFAWGMIVKGDEIVRILPKRPAGFKADDKRYKIVDLNGRLVLPGLHDAHLHLLDAMPIPTCDLENQARTLAEISGHVKECFDNPEFAGDEWLVVGLWNFYNGNQPGEEFKTIREALDAVSTEKPIMLFGSDEHHYAVNSPALARAKNKAGEMVGYSKETIATDFADIAFYIGVDENGAANGRITEDNAFDPLGAPQLTDGGMDKRRAAPELMMQVTLPNGITSLLDAATDPDTLDIFDKALAKGAFHARAHLAMKYDPAEFTGADGKVDYDLMLSLAQAARQKYANEPLIKADFLKLFADGVLEGDPLADPPTLPNAASMHDFLQPIFQWDDAADWVKVVGYVDLDSDTCVEVRDEIAAGAMPEPQGFKAVHGFHPAQCIKSNGMLQHPEQVIMDYVRLADAAGFTMHIHAIGDRTIKIALDAIEAARKENHSTKRHIITHLQLVRPEDQPRFAENDVYASFTFAWATPDPQYDTTVFPFFDRVDGPGGYYSPENYYYSNVYPAESIRKAGGVLIAGSDAPVDSKNPRPFINIQDAVTRSFYGDRPLNADQAISIFDAVDAYTINAARALKQDDIAGSLEPGKKADFAILDRDIFDLAETAPLTIKDTQVLETWFAGEKVYEKKN